MARLECNGKTMARFFGRGRFSIWIAIALLLAAFGLALTSARVKSATFDEDAYIGKGAAIWMEGNYWLTVMHPALGPMLSTLPLLTEPELSLPTDHPCWPNGTARSCGRELLFYRSETQRVLLLARLPTMLLMLILAALVYRWATELFGRGAGLVALALCALDPNVLAHARLVTLDLFTALTVCLGCFAFWRFWVRPTWGRLTLLGIALGAAGAIHFVNALLVPLFVLLSLIRVWHPLPTGKMPALRSPSRWRRLRVTLALLLAIGGIAGLVIWVIHGADFGPVPLWNGIRLPAPAYFNELAQRMQGKLGAPHSFLSGYHYEGGWWPYFIVALFVKTPWPTVFLITAAVVCLVRRGDGCFGDAVLLTAVGAYFALALLSNFNRGYRYILPLLPLLFVFTGRVARRAGRWLHYVQGGLLSWLAVANLAIYPHYLAYFNELVGPRDGHRVLVDSNLDWGQDLPALERHVAEHDVPLLYLSWFGESRPWQYDIPYRFIPSKPDELSDIFTRVYHPDYPPPGTYAISATNLQALLFDDKDLFAFFLRRQPVAQPGYSIMIYHVPRLLDAEAPPVTVALGSKQIDQVPPTVFEDFWHTNDLRLRWFDAETSCIVPDDSEVWYVLGTKAESQPPPCLFWEEMALVARLPKRGGDGELGLYHLQMDRATREERLAELAANSPLVISDEVAFTAGDGPELRREALPALRFGDRLDLVGYQLPSDTLRPGSDLQMTSYWQVVRGGGERLKLFVQLLDQTGSARARYDGLDVPVIGWQAGDLLEQRHDLSLPKDLAPGRYWVQVGAYEVSTGERLHALIGGESVGTRALLPPVEVR